MTATQNKIEGQDISNMQQNPHEVYPLALMRVLLKYVPPVLDFFSTSKGQVWTRHFAPAAPAFTTPSWLIISISDSSVFAGKCSQQFLPVTWLGSENQGYFFGGGRGVYKHTDKQIEDHAVTASSNSVLHTQLLHCVVCAVALATTY